MGNKPKPGGGVRGDNTGTTKPPRPPVQKPH